MTLQQDETNLSILASNISMLPEVVSNKTALEHIYLGLVRENKENFVITLSFDLKKTASKATSVKQVHAFFNQLETILDAAERAYLITKIDGREVTPYKLIVNNCRKGFSYTLNYFDGRMLQSKDYTQKEMYSHPRLMRDS